MIYVFIFFAKLIEVSLATVRNVLINRGEKAKGAIIAFFEAMLWIYVISSVLSTISQDFIKVILYCLAFALGNYFGVIIENKLAIGTSALQAIVSEDNEIELCEELRKSGFALTTLKGKGREKNMAVLMIYLKRKRINQAIEIIHRYNPECMVTVNDLRQVRNGFIKK